MIKKIKHKGLRKFYRTGSLKGIIPVHALRLRMVLARLDASKTPQDMNLPALDFHPLVGEHAGFWAVSVSGNWRVIFQFEDGEATNVDYLDYH
jgi:proteic killer suppression protein